MFSLPLENELPNRSLVRPRIGVHLNFRVASLAGLGDEFIHLAPDVFQLAHVRFREIPLIRPAQEQHSTRIAIEHRVGQRRRHGEAQAMGLKEPMKIRAGLEFVLAPNIGGTNRLISQDRLPYDAVFRMKVAAVTFEQRFRTSRWLHDVHAASWKH